MHCVLQVFSGKAAIGKRIRNRQPFGEDVFSVCLDELYDGYDWPPFFLLRPTGSTGNHRIAMQHFACQSFRSSAAKDILEALQ